MFSYNIAQALQNAGLVMRIDHWVMEVDPSQIGRISKNPGFPGSGDMIWSQNLGILSEISLLVYRILKSKTD